MAKYTSQFPPGTSPEARENKIIADAYDLAEKRIAEGTASSQVVTHFLKIGSARDRLERTRLENENELTREKIESLRSGQRLEEAYTEALAAMRTYQGVPDEHL